MPRSAVTGSWPHIDPGAKRHPINIFAQSTTQDSFGQETTALGTEPVLSCWAAIDTDRAHELFQDGFVSQVFHTISIDWPSVAITADMRVVAHPDLGAGASLYEIQGIENVQERNLVMVLTCIEINNQKVG